MVIPIPTGSRHTATLTVEAWIPVRCEHCSATFAYLTRRQAVGQGSSVLWLDEAGAKERAKQQAVSKLEKELARTADPVPCPQCGRLQTPMLDRIRRSRRAWGWGLGTVLALGWLVWALIVWSGTAGGYWAAAFGYPPVLAGIAALAAVLAGYAWARRLDPVAVAGRRRKVQPATTPLTRDEYEGIAKVGWVLAQQT